MRAPPRLTRHASFPSPTNVSSKPSPPRQPLHAIDIDRQPAQEPATAAMAAAAVIRRVQLVVLVLVVAGAAEGAETTTPTTHIKVYWHDVVSGADPTAVQVAKAATKGYFGVAMVIDDPLTEGPDINSSAPVGRAQGTYISAGKDKVALLMNMNFVFQSGSYNGSTVAIMGRNEVFSAVREMAIVGGTGVFRWAQGYAQARTHTLDMKTGDATVEYNLYIKH
ncbi:dirigent protein 22-like [Oryza brachyantha]|uniref:dirigent protein 22-like n=1 Tax=Oryza brachyantha TaxID=4533 RepID=UPI001ADAF8B8|nr:dirigent protein 22-like [Oryza brachyantha]